MPVKYHIDPARRLILSEAEEPVTPDEVEEYFERLARDPEFCPDFDHISDYSAVDLGNFSSEKIRKIASVQLLGPNARRAIVVSDGLPYGLVRMYQLNKGEPPNLELFPTIEEALTWLGHGRSG